MNDAELDEVKAMVATLGNVGFPLKSEIEALLARLEAAEAQRNKLLDAVKMAVELNTVRFSDGTIQYCQGDSDLVIRQAMTDAGVSWPLPLSKGSKVSQPAAASWRRAAGKGVRRG